MKRIEFNIHTERAIEVMSGILGVMSDLDIEDFEMSVHDEGEGRSETNRDNPPAQRPSVVPPIPRAQPDRWPDDPPAEYLPQPGPIE